MGVILVLIVVAVVLCGVIKGLSDSEKQLERKTCEEEKNEELINTVIFQSKDFSIDMLITQRNEVRRVYNELEECRRAGSMKIKDFAWIWVGNKFGVSLDRNTSYKILQYLNSEIEKRS